MDAEPEPFAPRERRGPGVHSSSQWPSNEPMCMHHESSYALQVPQTLIFACLSPPDRGGVTGLADSTEVLRRLPRDLTDRFRREGWLLVRSFGEVVGIPWHEAFGTSSRAEVESYCQANGIEWTWQRDGGLTTRQRRRAVLAHPVTGEKCWFNQVAFLNEWTLAPEVRDFLCAELGRARLPFNTLHGSGDPVTPEEVSAINDVYEELTERTPWGRGDLVIVDNLRTAHSREVYEGPRDVVVVMADPYRPELW
jgi:alpha-ketoglutarate-dependent taurine dioxygenase